MLLQCTPTPPLPNTDSKVVRNPGNSTTVTFSSSVPVIVLAPAVVYKLDDTAELPSWWLRYWRNWTDEQASSARPIELLDLERDTKVISGRLADHAPARARALAATRPRALTTSGSTRCW